MTRAQLDELLRNEPADPSPLDALDNREMEVLSLLSQGSNSSFIAREMLIAPEQLAAHKKSIQTKLRLKNEMQLIQYAAKQKASAHS